MNKKALKSFPLLPSSIDFLYKSVIIHINVKNHLENY
jgi:hypothetical protein